MRSGSIVFNGHPPILIIINPAMMDEVWATPKAFRRNSFNFLNLGFCAINDGSWRLTLKRHLWKEVSKLKSRKTERGKMLNLCFQIWSSLEQRRQVNHLKVYLFLTPFVQTWVWENVKHSCQVSGVLSVKSEREHPLTSQSWESRQEHQAARSTVLHSWEPWLGTCVSQTTQSHQWL